MKEKNVRELIIKEPGESTVHILALADGWRREEEESIGRY
jgi:hypothetical protein